MKKIIMLFSGLLLLSACSAAPKGSAGDTASGGNEQSGDTIKIGVNLELSGAVAAYGNQEKDGIEMAVKEINDAGGIDGKNIEIIMKDNKSDSTEAVSVTTSLTTKDKVVAMIGPATSAAVKSSLPNATKVKVPLVTPSGTDDSITLQGDAVQPYAFRTCFQDSFQGKVLAVYATDTLNAKKRRFSGITLVIMPKG